MVIIYSILEHHVLTFVILLIVIVASFIWRDYLKKILKLPHKLLNKIKSFFRKISNHKAVTTAVLGTSQYKAIRSDILEKVMKLQTATDDDTINTILNSLLEYPSPEGYVAIMQYISSNSNKDIRVDLLKAMYESAEAYEWYV